MPLAKKGAAVTDIDIHLPVADIPIDEIADLARRAERLGYDRVWQPETWGRDAVTATATIAERTDEIGIGTSILNVYSRSPALLGQTASTLQELSDGRFRLGVGPSGPIVIESWHGIDFDRPLRRTREAVEIIRAVTSGETVEYDGDVFSLSGFRLRSEPADEAPPVDVAAMGPKGVELAGRFSDGWHGTVLSPAGIRDRLEDLERGAELGGRSIDDVRATISSTVCAHEDADVARDLAREHFAFYVGGMGTYYRDALARQGYEEEANEIAAAWSSGDREEAAALVTEEIVDEFLIAGTPEDVRETIERYTEIDGVDAVAIGFPHRASLDRVRDTMHAAAPE
jgi:coenzyme F420-dependent oxidoreductase